MLCWPIFFALQHISTISAYTGDDIDECTPNICQLQVCTNTEGSFICGCEAGYVLDNSEGASCSGILINFISPNLTYLLLALCDDITLTNGMVTYDPTSFPRLEGTMATHICNSDSIISGEPERTCQSILVQQ